MGFLVDWGFNHPCIQWTRCDEWLPHQPGGPGPEDGRVELLGEFNLYCGVFNFPYIYIQYISIYIYDYIYICVHNMYFRLWSWIDFLYISEGSLKADKFASASASLPCQLRQKMTWITRIQNVSFNGEKWIDDMDRNGTEMGYHLSISWVYPTIKIHWNG